MASDRFSTCILREDIMFNRSTHTVERTDPDIWSAIESEHRRQEQHIELIASEN